MIVLRKWFVCAAVAILFLLPFTSCSLFEKLSPSFEISNLKCKDSAVYFDFYNDSSKIISSMQIFVSVRNKKTGESIGPSTGMLSCEFKQEIQGHEKKEMFISFEDYLEDSEDATPVLELVSLVVNRIVYSDGTIWKDTFGLFDAVNTSAGTTSIKEVSHEPNDSTAVPEPVEGPEDPAEAPEPTETTDPATTTDPIDPAEPVTTTDPTESIDPSETTDPIESPDQPVDTDPTVDPDPTVVPEPVEGPQQDPVEESPLPKMTLLIYMAADNDLESYAIQNLKAMEHSSFENMNVLVLLDRAEKYDETNDAWTDTRLFELVHDETDSNFIVSKRLDCPILGISSTSQTELDMGNFNVLKNFITFAKNEYEAEKYSLIIWGHGTGWRYSALPTNHNSSRAVAIDDKSGSYMSVSQMGRALKNQGICVVGFDTCFAGVFENVYEIRNYAAYTVASPGVSPSSGWDYRYLLEDLSECSFNTKEIARIMAQCSLVNTTIFDNTKLYDVMEKFETFSEKLSGTITNAAVRNSVLDSFTQIQSYSYRQYPCDLFIDIRAMAQYYSASSNSSLQQASNNLMTSIDRAATTTSATQTQIGIHLISLIDSNVYASSHSIDYKKDYNNTDQCMFIKESQWWVPSLDGTSQSVLDKLFYWNY